MFFATFRKFIPLLKFAFILVIHYFIENDQRLGFDNISMNEGFNKFNLKSPQYSNSMTNKNTISLK